LGLLLFISAAAQNHRVLPMKYLSLRNNATPHYEFLKLYNPANAEILAAPAKNPAQWRGNLGFMGNT